ncbi:hypothetical protein TNCT_680431 [Trichonephila clavata]|uniref:Regulatory protein zeste n=1 Tax=Trichonephila clavata TaxID=2740835 RepID=A0A8X6GD44_TRICU|nr:hypothetical protein TNCT_680431 [Trichonephila clavata]
MSKTNFSVQEMELLVNLVEKYKHFLNCKITNAVFNKKKEEAWDSLTTDFNAASLYERLAAMGALIEPLPCRFDCDYVYETAVSSGTQGGESAVVLQVDESIFTPDDHTLDVSTHISCYIENSTSPF